MGVDGRGTTRTMTTTNQRRDRIMAEVTSGNVTVIVLTNTEADTLAEMLECALAHADTGKGLPSDWEAFADELGVL